MSSVGFAERMFRKRARVWGNRMRTTQKWKLSRVIEQETRCACGLTKPRCVQH